MYYHIRISLAVLSVYILVLFTGPSIHAQCNFDDWTALKAFYQSTNGDNWLDKSGWEVVKNDSPPTYCNLSNLYGVHLNNNGRVFCLDLDGVNDCKWIGSKGGNNLIGNITSNIGLISNLEKLYLDNNQLSGEIPVEISNLNNLKNLYLYNNQLSGSIPSEIGNLNNLKLLSLGKNKFSGSIPSEIGVLNNLVQLGISNNQLSGNIPSAIGNLNKLKYLVLDANQFTGGIPPELGQLSFLEKLTLSNNRLTGFIPPQLGNLGSLKELNLSWNKLDGSIPTKLGDLSNLTILKLAGNQLGKSIPSTFGNLSELTILHLNYNELSASIPVALGNLFNLVELKLNRNELVDDIPIALSNLNNLKTFELDYNNLSGSIPAGFGNLNQLNLLTLHNNRLNGEVPLFSQTELSLDIYNNYFSCADIQNHFNNNQQIAKFIYSPQFYTPINYDSIKANIFDTLSINRSLSLTVDLPFNTSGLTYQWYRYGNVMAGEKASALNIDNIQTNTLGKYFLRVKNENCLPNLELISEPIYVILKGYDLYGQPVEYDQIMVEFDNPVYTRQNEDEILIPNAGWVKKACKCNRELYLWQFPSTDNAVAALLAIDQKSKRIKRKTELKGGFNNNLSIGESIDTPLAYQVISDAFNNNYPDSVSVYILDSGMDEQNYNETSFLYNQAPLDSCYSIVNSSGYSFIDTTRTITSNYADDVWHGTFGFHSITSSLNVNTKLKLVPLKIFDQKGEGTLFDMVCALYHAVDHQADIINISAGYQGEPSAILESALNFARKNGIFVTAAAGNDTINIDNLPQYPAYYSGKYYTFETIDGNGNIKLDSVQYDNIISIASIDEDNKLSQFSNYGKQSVTLAAIGENIYGRGLGGTEVVASGTSMSTFFVTKVLAIEIANDNKRNYKQILQDFEVNWLVENPLLLDITQTGKQINFELESLEIEGCTDETNCNYFPFATSEDGSCLPVYINTNNVIDKISNLLHANDSIISNSVMEDFDTITYKAGNFIRLEKGFSIQKNTKFVAEIETCK